MAREKPTFTTAKNPDNQLPGGKIVPIKPGKNKLEELLSDAKKASKLLGPEERKVEKYVDDGVQSIREKRDKVQFIKVTCKTCKSEYQVHPAFYNDAITPVCDACIANKKKARRR